MNIITVIDTINEMKKDGVLTDYAISGAVGATFYLEPFSNFDVDIFELEDRFDAFKEKFKADL